MKSIFEEKMTRRVFIFRFSIILMALFGISSFPERYKKLVNIAERGRHGTSQRKFGFGAYGE